MRGGHWQARLGNQLDTGDSGVTWRGIIDAVIKGEELVSSDAVMSGLEFYICQSAAV
jgi:hypothetical protein